MCSPDSIKILILWTVAPSLVEEFRAVFYSLYPHQSYCVASLARSRSRLTGRVRCLASMAHRSTGNASKVGPVVRCLASLAHDGSKRVMSRWSSGYLLDYEPRDSGSIPEVTNLEICALRNPSTSWILADEVCAVWHQGLPRMCKMFINNRKS